MKGMTKLLIVAALFFLPLGCVSCNRMPVPQEKAKDIAMKDELVKQSEQLRVKNKKLAPDFQLLDTRQDRISLKDYRGKQPVLLFFWTTLCPLCEEELRILNDSYPSLVSDGLEVLAIDVAERPSKVEEFIKAFHLTYRVLLDMDTSVAVAYRVFGVPTYVLIDKEGSIVFQDNYFPQNEYKKLIQE
ncbi:MAG TPA: redoxin domain-containing protein [Candidatus Omnitrophota bacterium]|nr:redoxin domain-containing protein [Candidatus Omnitrophota bacterium]